MVFPALFVVQPSRCESLPNVDMAVHTPENHEAWEQKAKTN